MHMSKHFISHFGGVLYGGIDGPSSRALRKKLLDGPCLATCLWCYRGGPSVARLICGIAAPDVQNGSDDDYNDQYSTIDDDADRDSEVSFRRCRHPRRRRRFPLRCRIRLVAPWITLQTVRGNMETDEECESLKNE